MITWTNFCYFSPLFFEISWTFWGNQENIKILRTCLAHWLWKTGLSCYISHQILKLFMFQVTRYPVFGYAVLAEWLWMLGWRGVMLLWAYFGLVSSVVWFFQGCGGAYGLCPKSRAHRVRVLSRLPRFILLGSFSDTLLVVSILDIV